METAKLTGAALDWAVTMAENWAGADFEVKPYSSDWAQGGPLIEREGISINSHLDGFEWFARDYWGLNEHAAEKPLTAAMRCYVANKLGDTVEIPAELL